LQRRAASSQTVKVMNDIIGVEGSICRVYVTLYTHVVTCTLFKPHWGL